MDIQLQELLDTIRREGLDAARGEAEKVAAEAQARAAAILAEAEKEAKAIRAEAEADARRSEAAGKAAIGQAARDLALAFRDGISAALSAIVRSEVVSSYGPEVVAECIPPVVKALAEGGSAGLEILVPAASAAKLEAYVSGKLSGELKRGLSIKPYPGLSAGFRIAEKDGSAYYDFSAEEIADLLARRLNPRIADAVRSAVKGL